jgi:hypothetical protein
VVEVSAYLNAVIEEGSRKELCEQLIILYNENDKLRSMLRDKGVDYKTVELALKIG